MDYGLDLSNMVVLVVDDTALMRAMHKKHLLELGFLEKHIHPAENGQKGFSKLEQLFKGGEKVNLIICDWDMPIVSGLSFLQKIRSLTLTKSIPFLMVTGHDKKEEYAKVVEAGVDGIITKPFKADTYNKKIVEIMSKQLMGM